MSSSLFSGLAVIWCVGGWFLSLLSNNMQFVVVNELMAVVCALLAVASAIRENK